MKRAIPFLALLFAACTSVQTPIIEPTKVDVQIGAAMQQGSTKATYEPNSDRSSFEFIWDEADQISLIVPDVAENANAEFRVQSNGTNTTIMGELTTWSGEKEIYAIYPYQETKYSAGSDKTISISRSTQTIDLSDDRVENGVMVAAVSGATLSSDNMVGIPDLEFCQAMSFFLLELKDIPSSMSVTKVELYSTDAIFVASANIDLASGEIVEGSESMTRSVVAEIEGQSGSTAQIYFALLPVDLSSQSLTMKVTTSSGYTYSKIFNTATNFKRNTIHYLTTGAIGIYMEIIL